tara:strand:- start:2031 stop:2903 length:873 start_codon:yes stop_codon:yes gene_type:complete
MAQKNPQKSHKEYYCISCDYKCSNKKDYEKHLLTQKHNAQKCSEMLVKNPIIYECNCGKLYKHKQSYNRHKKKCEYIESNIHITDISDQNMKNDEDFNYKEMFYSMMNENKDLRKQITDILPKVGNNNTNIKQKVNINVFLNEYCKDAINMNDFIKSIEVSLQQLDYTNTNGIEQGLSNVILENMNKLSLYERPLHCTDTKRETLYVKDNNIWEKDKTKEKLKKAIKDVSNKQYKALKEWTHENPDFQNNENKQKYFAKTLSTIGKTTDIVDNKIIKNICNSSYIKENND